MNQKIAVSLPDELVADARAAVAAGRSASVSGYVAEAMRGRRDEDALADVIAEMVAEGGAPTEADLAWAREALTQRPRG